MTHQESYDYVIVGAGSAGCVMAARLSEDPDTTVLLLEAGGPDKADEITIPAAFSKLFKTSYDWAYTTEPQEHVDGREMYWPRGKVIGGSSSMNAMIYMRGNRLDYDDWAAGGMSGWSYEDLLPYFRRAEDNERGEDEYHGAGGPLRVENLRSPHPYTLSYLEAASAAGFEANDDFNGAKQEGAGLHQVTQRRGQRWSAAKAYLHPAEKRPNLTVRPHAPARRVLVESGRAVGVEYGWQGRDTRVRALCEVILCGGAINSPQLLMLSGLGPADHLREHGIDVVADLPGVGENLHDHPSVAVLGMTKSGRSLIDAERPIELFSYYARRRGMLTSNVGEGGAFFSSREGLPAPDLQFHFAPFPFLHHALREPIGHSFVVAPTLVHVASRGRLRLAGPHPAWAPSIDPAYFSAPEDLEAMVAGVRRAREVMAEKPLASLMSSEYLPGADVTDDEGLHRYLRQRIETLYHPVGTCRAGSDEGAVVDPELRVRGVQGLRVVDASVMPTVTRGNTNAPVIAIAERASDLVRDRAPLGTRHLTAV
jgi:choline dehydrogenase